MRGRHLLRRTGTAIVVLAVAAALLTVGARLAGFTALVERSASMAPAIERGDLLIVRDVRADVIASGDVVTFHDPARAGRRITHRVTGVQREAGVIEFRTRGDANTAEERWSRAAGEHLGRSVGTVTGAGALVGALGDPLVLVCLAGILVVALVSAVAGRRRHGPPVWRSAEQSAHRVSRR